MLRLARFAVLVGGAVVLVSGCGGSSGASGTPGPAAPSRTPGPVADQPLAFYATQYEKIGAPCLAAQRALNTSKTKAEVLDKAKAASSACQASDAALLAASWPAKVLADIMSAVAADRPLLRDLADPENHRADLPRDYANANAAASALRRELGLPPTG